jgi:hypothetical protein
VAYGHLNEVCAPRRKRYEDWFHKRLIRYHTVMVVLTTLYRRGELSLCTWYRAEQIAAERSKLPENSIYRLWHPDYGRSFEEQRAERLYYLSQDPKNK